MLFIFELLNLNLNLKTKNYCYKNGIRILSILQMNMIINIPLSDNISASLNLIPMTIRIPKENNNGNPPNQGVFNSELILFLVPIKSETRYEIAWAKGTIMIVKQIARKIIKIGKAIKFNCSSFEFVY